MGRPGMSPGKTFWQHAAKDRGAAAAERVANQEKQRIERSEVIPRGQVSAVPGPLKRKIWEAIGLELIVGRLPSVSEIVLCDALACISIASRTPTRSSPSWPFSKPRPSVITGTSSQTP